MRLHELTTEQKTELKETMLEDILGRAPSWGDLSDANELISDGQLEMEYGEVDFCDDDFFCSQK